MDLKRIIEAILFHAQKPMNPAELREVLAAAARESEEPTVRIFKRIPIADIENALMQIEAELTEPPRSFRLACVAGAWQFVSPPEYAPWLRTLLGEKAHPPRLSQPALETLAIIAYRQPITRAEIEQIRGVNVDGVVQTLLDRQLIETVGRADTVGRPMTYGTTAGFLEHFGLRSLEELPAADELRRIEVKKPEQLLTVETGLATAPDPQLNLPMASAASAEATVADQLAASTAEGTKEKDTASTENGMKL